MWALHLKVTTRPDGTRQAIGWRIVQHWDEHLDV
jgi:hypothetical protein